MGGPALEVRNGRHGRIEEVALVDFAFVVDVAAFRAVFLVHWAALGRERGTDRALDGVLDEVPGLTTLRQIPRRRIFQSS